MREIKENSLKKFCVIKNFEKMAVKISHFSRKPNKSLENVLEIFQFKIEVLLEWSKTWEFGMWHWNRLVKLPVKWHFDCFIGCVLTPKQQNTQKWKWRSKVDIDWIRKLEFDLVLLGKRISMENLLDKEWPQNWRKSGQIEPIVTKIDLNCLDKEIGNETKKIKKKLSLLFS